MRETFEDLVYAVIAQAHDDLVQVLATEAQRPLTQQERYELSPMASADELEDFLTECTPDTLKLSASLLIEHAHAEAERLIDAGKTRLEPTDRLLYKYFALKGE